MIRNYLFHGLIYFFIFFTFWMVNLVPLKAEMKLNPFQRIAVFPIGNASYSTSEDAWWQMRDLLTQDQRFLVSARRFMINRGVFQPRFELKPSEAIILAKILEAEVLIVCFVMDRTFSMKAYLGVDGTLLWEQNKEFHSTVPIQEQLVSYASFMIQNFLSQLPFHGWLLLEETKGDRVWIQNGEWYTWSIVGKVQGIEKGEKVQLVHLVGSRDKPFFSSPKSIIICEGEVSFVETDKVLIHLDKLSKRNEIDEATFVLFPNKIASENVNTEKDLVSNLTNEYLTKNVLRNEEKFIHNSTWLNLSYIFGLGTYILIAF